MDSTKKYVKRSPEKTASYLSKRFYWWYLPFFKFGYQNDIKLKDIYNTVEDDLSEPLGDTLQRNWEKELNNHNKKKPSLEKAIFQTFWKPYSLPGIAIFIHFVVIRMLQPFILTEFINFFSKQDEEYWGYIWASGVILLAFGTIIIIHNTDLATLRVGMRVRIAVSSLIYRKLLRLNHSSLGETASGEIVNLLSNDVQRFDMAALWLHYIWIFPIFVVIAFYILYRYVGLFAAIVGMGFITLQSLFLQGCLSRWQGKLRYKIAVRTDKRIKLMSEITSAMQVIKMYAWEKPFEKVVELSRKLEINVISKTSYCFAIRSSMSVFTERLILYITVITLVLVGRKLTGDVAFSLVQFYNGVQLIMTIFFPDALTTYSEAKVSISRLEKFLMLEEKPQLLKNYVKEEKENIGTIKLSDVTASWKSKCISPTLTNIDLDIKPGTLCCIVGDIGSGKTSLLQVLLKELPITGGNMTISGKISYSAQEPWLFASNIRDNILFGKSFDKNKYNKVINVCSLETDFKQFLRADKTLVGERGVSLSGGQRARVNLARAVYSEADIYLLDDPLSAVDPEVGRHLFDQCIIKYLDKKTRILVTHQLQFLKEADVIVVINNGKIDKIAKFNELTENELNYLQKQSNIDDKENLEYIQDNFKDPEKKENFSSVSSFTNSDISDKPEEMEELIEKRTISNSTYEYYRSGAGILFLSFVLLVFLFSQMIANATDLWLMHWINSEAIRDAYTSRLHSKLPSLLNLTDERRVRESVVSSLPTTIPPTNTSLVNSSVVTTAFVGNVESQDYYIRIYSTLIAATVVVVFYRSFVYFQVCMNASKVLHNKMFRNILEAPMRFFDTNPSGRILNRFSKDMGAVDEILPRCQINALQVFFVMAGILVTGCLLRPLMIIPVIALAPLLYFLRAVYTKTAQSIKRLEGNAKAPVFSHISASMYGISTIRASNAEEMISKEFDALQDQHTSTWFLFLVSNAAFELYIDMLCFIFLTFVTFQFLIFRNENTLSGNVGLIMSQTLILTCMVPYGIKQSAEASNNMISVERILQYTKLNKEGPFESLSTKKPPVDWPEKGKIIFKDMFLRYDMELLPALRNINFEIRPGEKIGVVGRTGAGKSSLISSLFRLAPTEGVISIDGIDISEIGLNDLRSNISIIPQEPVLFSASLRYNLDPFQKYSDEVLWKALENVELKNAITDLNQSISEGGSNFSAGQRQLLCLARAIIRDNKIIVLDEATANVDPRTTDLIQKTMRDKFKNHTVITVAHRLNTIMDSDRVLVMDAGEIIEFDHPHKLLQQADGYFSKMVKETGPLTAITLHAAAREHYNEKESVLQ